MNAIYARQSLDKKDSISIDTQIDFCKKEIADGDSFIVFKDRGFSGKNTSRPDFIKMMKAIERGEIKKVIVYRLDRFSRSITDFSGIMNKFGDYSVDFVSASEKFDTSAPMGRAMLFIIMVFAQLERETIAERIRDNYYARGKNGVWLGGPAPLGFKNAKAVRDGKKIALLEPDDNIGIIREIFELYADTSASLGGIAKIMKEKYGGMWNNVKLARIIHNPAYVKADADIFHYYQYRRSIIVNEIDEFVGENGCSLYGKRDRGANKYNTLEENVLSLAVHKGVIDSGTWLKCQEKASKNKQIKNTGKGKHSWLTGLIKCGYCGYGMVVKTYADMKYLVCTGRYATKLCAEKLSTHYLSDIENYIQAEIIKYVNAFPKQDLAKNTSSDNQINDLKIKLHKIEDEIKNLLDSISAANSVLMKYINEKIIALDRQKNDVLKMINDSAVAPKGIEMPDVNGMENAGINLKRDIANKVISKILLYNDKVEVHWKA